MRLLSLALFLAVLVQADECVPRCEVEEACEQIQLWVNDVSQKELGGEPLSCADIDNRLVNGLSIVNAARSSCSLDFPTPEYLLAYAQLRLQQSAKKVAGIRLTVAQLQQRISAVLHCEVPVECLPVCGQVPEPAPEPVPEPLPVPVAPEPVPEPVPEPAAPFDSGADAIAALEAEIEKELNDEPAQEPVEPVEPVGEPAEEVVEQPVEEPLPEEHHYILGYIIPKCVPKCHLDSACAKIQAWVDDASDKELAGQSLGCRDMDSRLTEGLSVLGPNDQCFIDFPSPAHIRKIRKLQELIDKRRELGDGTVLNSFMQKATATLHSKVGIAISRQQLIERISSVLHCNIPVPCVPVCDSADLVFEPATVDVVPVVPAEIPPVIIRHSDESSTGAAGPAEGSYSTEGISSGSSSSSSSSSSRQSAESSEQPAYTSSTEETHVEETAAKRL